MRGEILLVTTPTRHCESFHRRTWQSLGLDSKHDCSATFQGRAIAFWHEAEALRYIFAFWFVILTFEF